MNLIKIIKSANQQHLIKAKTAGPKLLTSKKECKKKYIEDCIFILNCFICYLCFKLVNKK